MSNGDFQNQPLGDYQSKPQFTLQPSVAKVCLLNVSKVIIAVIIILGLIYYLSTLVDLSIFKEALDIKEGELPSMGDMTIRFVIAVIIASVITLTLSYLSIGKKQHLFYTDRLESYKSYMLFNVSKKTFPYTNIVSIRAVQDFTDSLLGTGRIVIGLTAMKEKNVTLEFIDKADEYVPYIQTLLNNARTQYGMAYQQNKTIQNTLDRMD